MHKLCVIYVDDETLALENFKATMRDCAIFEEISLFSNAHDALAHAKMHPIDVAFLDIDLPVTDGFALSAQLKKVHPQLHIAFITGNVRYMNPHNQMVAAPYIFKPYTQADVLSALLHLAPP